MSPEDEFEQALQQYITACLEYKLAITRYVRDVGMQASLPKLRDAEARQIQADQRYLSQEEIDLRMSRATRPIVDADETNKATSLRQWPARMDDHKRR